MSTNSKDGIEACEWYFEAGMANQLMTGLRTWIIDNLEDAVLLLLSLSEGFVHHFFVAKQPATAWNGPTITRIGR